MTRVECLDLLHNSGPCLASHLHPLSLALCSSAGESVDHTLHSKRPSVAAVVVTADIYHLARDAITT